MPRIIAALLLYMYIMFYMCSSTGCAMRHEELTGAHAPRRQFHIYMNTSMFCATIWVYISVRARTEEKTLWYICMFYDCI